VSFWKQSTLAGHKERVFDLSWSPSASCLASAGQTGGFVWCIDEGAAQPPVRLAGELLMRVCWHPDGSLVLTGSADGTLCSYNPADGNLMETWAASGDEEEVYGLEMLPRQGHAATGSGSSVQLWDLENCTACVVESSLAASENSVVFGGFERNPQGKAYVFSLAAHHQSLCAALSDGTLRLLDSRTLHQHTVLEQHARLGSPAFGVAISTVSPLLASADSAGCVLLWDQRLLGRGAIAKENLPGAVHSLAFVHDAGQELLVTGGVDGRLYVHQTRSSLRIEGSVGVGSPVLCVKTIPGTSTLASGGGAGGHCSDASIAIWS